MLFNLDRHIKIGQLPKQRQLHQRQDYRRQICQKQGYLKQGCQEQGYQKQD
jgi:hypothetical protein